MLIDVSNIIILMYCIDHNLGNCFFFFTIWKVNIWTDDDAIVLVLDTSNLEVLDLEITGQITIQNITRCVPNFIIFLLAVHRVATDFQ